MAIPLDLKSVISSVLVRPAYRRRGVGRELLARADADLRARGAASVSVGSLWPNNPYLFGLYGGSNSPGILSGEPVPGPWGWRPLLLITLSFVVFGYAMEKIGMVPALVLLFVVAALGGREFRITEVAILAVVMSAFAAGVFIYGLQLPYPLFGAYQ